MKKKHISEKPFLAEDFKSCKKDDEEWTKVNIVIHTSCLSFVLSGHKSNSATKVSLIRGAWLSSSRVLVVALWAHRSYPSSDKTQLFCPHSPIIWIWKPVIATKVCAFTPFNFRVWLHRQRGNAFYLGSLFLSPSAPPPTKEIDRDFHSQVLKDDKYGC